jgi:hypothetical protein
MAGPQFYLSENGVEPGTTITGTEPLSGSLLSSTAVLSSKAFGAKIKLTATGSVATGSIDNKTAENTMGHATDVTIHFTNVTTNLPGCSVEDTKSATPGTITTNALTGTATENGGVIGVSFTPEFAEPFVTLRFSGKECSAAGQTLEIKGTDFASVKKDVLKSEPAKSALKLGVEELKFEGEYTNTSTAKTVTEH